MMFSLIVPAHNSAGYIRKGLESIHSQTFKDYELIVICDSCTDNTEEIAKEYGAITEAVDYHCDGPTRNRGLEIAQGKWILFMDDDDWFLHEYVFEQLAGILNDSIDVLCFSFIFRGMMYATPDSNGGAHWIAAWCKCYKRTAIEGARFSSVTDGSADVQFCEQVFSRNLRVCDWNMPLYYYNYMRPGSITERNARVR